MGRLYWNEESTHISSSDEDGYISGSSTLNTYKSWGWDDPEWWIYWAYPTYDYVKEDGSVASYHGRGAKQLSWEYNYAPYSRVAYGPENAHIMLETPSLIFEEEHIFASALYFHMTPRGSKPSIHQIATGIWWPSDADVAQGIEYGFGATTNVINGGIECGSEPTNDTAALRRVSHFEDSLMYFSTKLGTDLWTGWGQEMSEGSAGDCSEQGAFTTNWAFYWGIDWSSSGVQLQTWEDNAWNIGQPGDYYRADYARNNSSASTDGLRTADYNTGILATYEPVGSDFSTDVVYDENSGWVHVIDRTDTLTDERPDYEQASASIEISNVKHITDVENGSFDVVVSDLELNDADYVYLSVSGPNGYTSESQEITSGGTYSFNDNLTIPGTYNVTLYDSEGTYITQDNIRIDDYTQHIPADVTLSVDNINHIFDDSDGSFDVNLTVNNLNDASHVDLYVDGPDGYSEERINITENQTFTFGDLTSSGLYNISVVDSEGTTVATSEVEIYDYYTVKADITLENSRDITNNYDGQFEIVVDNVEWNESEKLYYFVVLDETLIESGEILGK